MGYVRRWYQQAAIDALFKFFNTVTDVNRNPVVAIPTGGGKSSVIGDFVHEVSKLAPQFRFICAAHVKELVRGNADELSNAWPQAPIGIYSAGLRQKDTFYPIIYGSIQSMIKNPAAFGHRDILIVDEAQMVSPDENAIYLRFIAELRKINPNLRVVGLSATPFRMKSGMITDGPLFTDLVFDCTDMINFNRMITDGFIKPILPGKIGNITLDATGVKVNASSGDYAESSLQAKILADGNTYGALQQMQQYAHDRKSWLLFTTGIEHAEITGEMCSHLGISNVVVHSKMLNSRDEAINMFKSGQVRAMIVKEIATTGFNHPHIDAIGMLRPTKSPVLWVQMAGRGTRITPYAHNCLLFDFAQNTAALGPINCPRIPGKPSGKGGQMPICYCKECGLPNHASARICAYCGAEIFHDRDGKLSSAASTLDIIKGLDTNLTGLNAPIRDPNAMETITPAVYEWRKVDSMIAVRFDKKGHNPSLRVIFNTGGLNTVSQFVAIEENGGKGVQARDWWHLFTGESQQTAPRTVADALKRVSALHAPKWVKVWSNNGKKYPSVVKYSWATVVEEN